MGAPIATALSYIFGYIIAVNIFYQKTIHINVLKMFRGIISGTWICLVLTALVSIPLLFIKTAGVLVFILKGLFICIVYVFSLISIGFNQEEKRRAKTIILCRVKHRKF